MPTRDVLVIGGGPTGAATALFTARAGLDTLVLDRGPSSLRQCAHLGKYLGFPAGIDIPTFESVIQTQLREAGCEIREDEAEGVYRAENSFSVVTSGETHQTRRVVAATKYTGAYLKPLDDEGVVFLPLIGWGVFGLAITPAIAGATLVLHLVYGGVLGWGLDRTTTESSFGEAIGQRKEHNQ